MAEFLGRGRELAYMLNKNENSTTSNSQSELNVRTGSGMSKCRSMYPETWLGVRKRKLKSLVVLLPASVTWER